MQSMNYHSAMVVLCLFFSGTIAITTTSAIERPNILWITSEDNSISWVSCYGSKNVKTPAIDQLASEGFRYSHCFDNAAVCAPTRSLWITGMHAVSNGTQPMRSRNVIPHDVIKYYPDLLRSAGYHTSNPGKTDYNLGGRDDKDCWDYKRGKEIYGWKKCPPDKPFFCVLNIFDSHESRAHGEIDDYGVLQNHDLKTDHDPIAMTLFAYHPDLLTIRNNYAKYADAVTRMDEKVGRCIEELKSDGLYDETIIVYCSDHGGVLPRSKRFLYSSGTHCPLIIRIPEKYKEWWPAEQPGEVVDEIVSFVDMPKTWLKLAGAEIPETFQGKVFLGNQIDNSRKYHFAYRERADERYDSVRMIRDERFSYCKNYMPFVPGGQYLQYLWRAPAAEAWEEHYRDGKTDAITERFFKRRVSEEFYDNEFDFDNVNNLIDSPDHQQKIEELRQELRAHQLKYRDSGLMPETMRVRRAADNNLTIYEMVRKESLYPLERYLDVADMALSRNRDNLESLTKMLGDEDPAIRYWAIVGLHLLGPDASPAKETIQNCLNDNAEEVRMLAAWTTINLGNQDVGIDCLREMMSQESDCTALLHNVIDWIGEPAFELISEYKLAHKNEPGFASTILGRASRHLKN